MEILDDSISKETLTEQEQDWNLFIGDQANYYIPIWRKIQDGKYMHFNIPAFFLWVAWAGYRKMYAVYLILAVGRSLIVEYIPTLLGIGQQFQALLAAFFFLIFIAWGLFANYIYYNHAQKKIQAIKAQHLSQTEQEKAIIAAGNTDLVFPIVIGLVLMGISFSFQHLYGTL
ncbi:DUF2628 domain-containing protein [Aureispira anguillae]|uniref:DUF2628 domain-containing protein n=1 Tax=Aureispira anguillae TaxID=2864201 RepID=A0A915YC76_9BACT|nr:DUF2628 domain-containing protein [Aureispira anguillae]BDS10381.1 DUF2628 domain-containing protein [Aureispira anguillae]